MRNVMIVVPVLITSCQVSENLNIGPDSAHTTMRTTETANVSGLPDARAIASAKRENSLDIETAPAHGCATPARKGAGWDDRDRGTCMQVVRWWC